MVENDEILYFSISRDQFSSYVSRADFFALAATIAVQRGVRISNKERTDGKRYKTILNLALLKLHFEFQFNLVLTKLSGPTKFVRYMHGLF